MSIDINQLYANGATKKKASGFSFTELLTRDFSFRKGLPDKKKQWFLSELALLLNSGVDIKNALDLIVEEQKKGKEAAFFIQVREAVFAGDSLSQVIINSKKFDTYDNFAIRMGEESGNLPAVLNQLAEYYEKRLKLRRQLTSALSYPTLVMSAAIGAVVFLINFLVPMFEDVFNRFSGELPAITRNIIALSHSFSNNALTIFLVVVGMLVSVLLFRKQPLFRKVQSYLVLRIPIMGDIIRKNNMARFCQALGMLISSKVPLTEALRLVKDMVTFYPIETSLPIIIADIEKGNSLNQSLQQFQVYDNRMVYLIKVGEEVNQLDRIFEKLQQQYAADVEHRVSVMSSLLEPILIIGVGLLVGIILIAMYLPLFQISNSFM
ncbi:MAG: type II secretion system F family protein [Salinivirgaceae bacterium]